MENPTWPFFLKLFPPDHEVPVSLCHSKFFNSQECVTNTLRDYFEYWHGDRKSGLKYLKDWHFVEDCESAEIDYKAYTVPRYFQSDWLNFWLDGRDLAENEERSDYKFVYIGPKDSFTPFHSDVFGSFSWSANIVGIKEWIFVLPGDEKRVETAPDTYVYDVLSQQAKDLQAKHNGKVRMCRIIQRTGDVIFVPSGWFHQVRNVVDTISINHNWFNAANCQRIFCNLNSELKRVEQEISDCSDDPQWNRMCQNLLREHFGMNHLQFLDLLEFILKKSRDKSKETCQDSVSMSSQDVATIQNILPQLLTKLSDLGLNEESEHCESLIMSFS
eukprot:TRINITY_DN7439_c0_g1_i1.p1 TRINITY_DN7439_c0_g1~~TRINITY_DN7439_c0_g1_i1.p1  ORF type:complete len:330 (+),score=5.03 TRINITY_DN7439_c0_g1_i1:214-1203(+)